MARGRMISGTIGESRKFAALANDTHRLIYLMVMPHVDKAGRFEADPILIKGRCLTRLDIDASTVEAWLKDAAKVGLILFYEAKGIRVLEIVNFTEHNKPHHKEPESKLPGPDEGTPCSTREPNVEPSMSQARPKHEPSLPIIEVKESKAKEKEREHSSTSELATPAPRKLAAAPPRESHDPGLFLEIWNTNRGRLPGVTTLNQKRRRAIQALVKEHGAAEAVELFRDATRAVAADEFWLQRQYGLDILLAGKVLQRAEQWRAGASQLGAGNLKLVANVERWSKALPPDEGVN